jgi:hypothetical protein
VTRRDGCIIGLYACAVTLLGLAVASACPGDYERLYGGLIPFEQPLTAQGVRGSFVAVWSEPHEVMVALPVGSGIPEVDAFVERATGLVGHYQDRPVLDLAWRVYEKGVLIGSGSGSSGASAVSFGEGTRGFGFGTFPATANRVYDVVVDVGPRFEPFLRASPKVEVSVATATASVGLALSRSLGRTLTWGMGVFGAAVLGIAVWYQRHGVGRRTRG